MVWVSHLPSLAVGRRQHQPHQGWITILWMCMSRVALRWNDLCHVCGTTSGWWLDRTQPPAALVPSQLDRLWGGETTTTTTNVRSFQLHRLALPCARMCMRPVTVTQSRRLGTISLQAWPILLRLPPSHTHTLATPWRGQGQMNRGLYSLRFCRLNQVRWVSSSPPL